MVFIEVDLKKADGGFIVGCSDENTDHIFVTFSDAIDFILDYFGKNGLDDSDDSNNPENHKFADSPKEA